MNINFLTPRKIIVDTIADAINFSIINKFFDFNSGISANHSGGLFFINPLGCYVASLDSIGKGHGVSGSDFYNWLSIVISDEGSYICVYVTDTSDGVILNSIGDENIPVEIVNALTIAESDNEYINKNHEARLLSIPSIHLTVLWFFSDSESLFIPLKPFFMLGMKQKIYSEPDFLAIIENESKSVNSMLKSDTSGMIGN